ncbi:MAG: hypothetical protein QXL69_00875 [Candidatus Bathyarchaeia archaeon]|nr:hypothetical protein [Candidatus Bathyarchaeota archaeon]
MKARVVKLVPIESPEEEEGLEGEDVQEQLSSRLRRKTHAINMLSGQVI